MTQVMSGVLGISLGVVIVVGIQYICYKLFNQGIDYIKAVILSLSCVFLGILVTILIIEVV